MSSLSKKIGLLLIFTSLVSAAAAMDDPRSEFIGSRTRRIGDQESAMDSAITSAGREALELIYKITPDFSTDQINESFKQVKKFIQSKDSRNYEKKRTIEDMWQKDSTGKVCRDIQGNLIRKRDYVFPEGLSEYMRDNAWRALEGPRSATDWDAISDNNKYINLKNGQEVRMKEFLSRVWHLISNHSVPKEKSLMQENLFRNLNFCIEDDGHRTCNVGKTGRILQAIEGYVEGVNVSVNLPKAREFVNSYRGENDRRLQTLVDDPFVNFIFLIDDWKSTARALENRIREERQLGYEAIEKLYGKGTPRARETKKIMDEEIFADYQSAYNRWVKANPDHSMDHLSGEHCCRLAINYEEGNGVAVDFFRAFDYFEAGAKKGHAECQLRLGLRYYRGTFVEKNNERAEQLLRASEQQGNVLAQFFLGELYQHGFKDIHMAKQLYQKAADRGNDYAQGALGYMYYKGLGTAKNYPLARQLFQKAADQGYADAIFQLGNMCAEGSGVPKDIEQAMVYYKKAADMNCAGAQCELANLFFF